MHIVTTAGLPSSRHHPSYDDCLEYERGDYQNCSVLCCVQQLCRMIRTHIDEEFLRMTVGFYRAMHYSAQRDIAIVNLSVSLLHS